MAYLRWSRSPWYAFSHVDGGDGDDAVLVAWHVRGAGVTVTAGELRPARSQGSPKRLRGLMNRTLFSKELVATDSVAAALNDVDELAPAADQFLLDVYNAGKIAMPPEVANMYRELKRWIDETMADPCAKYPVDSRVVSSLFTWSVELDEIRRRYPPPRVSREIRDLVQASAAHAAR